MKIVVIGGGKVGGAITEHLSKENHEVTLIDTRQRVIADKTNKLDVLGVCGNGASLMVQTEAGMDKADIMIAATNLDELNLLCCLIAKKLGAKYTIARVRNPEYIDQIPFIREELSLSMTINPEYACAEEIFRILRFPSAIDIDVFAKGRVELVGLKLPMDCALVDVALKDLPRRFGVQVLVCVVQRNGGVTIPTGDFVLKGGDKISIAASHSEIENFFASIKLLKRQVETVMLIGGSRIAYYLARMLMGIGVRVKIIEKNEERCIELCELLPKAMIINGDGTDQSTLLEEGIDGADAVVTLTGSDEENIIISMYAMGRKPSKVVTKVARPALADLIDAAGLESIISPPAITANHIMQYVRAMQNTVGSNVETLYRLVGGKAEALEFIVKEDSPVIDTPLKDLELRPNILIASIARGHDTIIPRGGSIIKPGDSVIVVTSNERLEDIAEILK